MHKKIHLEWWVLLRKQTHFIHRELTNIPTLMLAISIILPLPLKTKDYIPSSTKFQQFHFACKSILGSKSVF